MPSLVVITYPDETSAAAAAEEAQRLARNLGLEPDGVAVVRRGGHGRFELVTNHHPVPAGPSWAMFWRLLFMLVFEPASGPPGRAGPLTLLAEVAAAGLDERFQDELRKRLAPGTSTLLLAVGTTSRDRVLAALERYGGTLLETSMTDAQEAELQEVLHGDSAVEHLSAGRGPTRPTG